MVKDASLDQMFLQVKGKVIRAGETAATGNTFKGLGSCMLSVVTTKLIRASKTPGASFPCALVWLLT